MAASLRGAKEIANALSSTMSTARNTGSYLSNWSQPTVVGQLVIRVQMAAP